MNFMLAQLTNYSSEAARLKKEAVMKEREDKRYSFYFDKDINTFMKI